MIFGRMFAGSPRTDAAISATRSYCSVSAIDTNRYEGRSAAMLCISSATSIPSSDPDPGTTAFKPEAEDAHRKAMPVARRVHQEQQWRIGLRNNFGCVDPWSDQIDDLL